MPEGDTIHRAANRLRPALVGQPLVRFEAPRAVGKRPAPGTPITAVDAVGQHLLVRFDDGTLLRTHMRMTGSWHLYEQGQRWQKPAHLARALVEVPGWVAVCFSAPVVELEHERTGGPAIAHLGPDLAAPHVTDADLDACVERLNALAQPDDEIGALLLDQRIACGVGNIWKSETLWTCGVDPAAHVDDLDATKQRQLFATASKLLQASVKGIGARTPPAVYKRRGEPCRRCGTPIKRLVQGARATYFCPSCQKR